MVAESGLSRSHTLTSEVWGAAGEESFPEQSRVSSLELGGG